MVTFNSAQIQAILDSHNKCRNDTAGGLVQGYQGERLPSAIKMAKVRWSPELARLAEYNVKTCVMAHDLCRSTNEFNWAGQNLAWRGSTFPINVTFAAIAAIEAWASEMASTRVIDITSYEGKTVNGSVIGHYTQMVNAKVTHIGCSMVTFFAQGFNQATFACNYAFGNFLRRYVYKAGDVAVDCKTGRDLTFPNLCTVDEDFDVNNPWT